MSYKSTDFPQYRKLSNEKVFYRLRSDRDFDEIQIVGSRAMWFSMKATKYPEILRISEMLSGVSPGILSSHESEFHGIAQQYDLASKLESI